MKKKIFIALTVVILICALAEADTITIDIII